MKKNKDILLLVILVLSLALSACAGGNNAAANAEPAAVDEPTAAAEEQAATEAPAAEAPAAAAVETDFPLLPDATGIMDTNGTIIYQSATSLADAFTFYQTEFTGQGLTENTTLTLNDETMFQFVFTGSENGKNLVVQTIKLDDKTINVTLRYE